MRNKVSNGIIGVIFIAIGVFLMGNILDWWNFNLFFDGWWTLFIIIPCICHIISTGLNSGSLIGLGIGVLLLLSAQDIIEYRSMWKIAVPAVFIIIGLTIIFNGATPKKVAPLKYEETTDAPNISAIFGGSSPNFSGFPFKGSNSIAIFGGVELNLRNAIITENCVINCTCVFGGIDIFVPHNVNVRLEGVPIFGGTDNNCKPTLDPNAPTILVKYVCVFGGIDIK